MKRHARLMITTLAASLIESAALDSWASGPEPVLLPGHAQIDSAAGSDSEYDAADQPFILRAEQFVQRDDISKKFKLNVVDNHRKLSDYNLQILVDRSMSMRKPDCPGCQSRWNWCGHEAAQLALSLKPFSPHGLTVIPFATSYNIYKNATSQDIDYLFSQTNLQWGTRLYEPLTEQLDSYLAHWKPDSKPLLLVVITDGQPVPRFEPQLVKNELIQASQRMNSPQQITVIFCQIGNADVKGQRYLTDLDQNLTSYGARYHFVHTIPFDQLTAKGLGPALVASIQNSGISHSAPLLTDYEGDLSESVWESSTRKPDIYIDDPSVDADGVRHFANGHHYDLARVPRENAIQMAQSSDSIEQQIINRQRVRRNRKNRQLNF